MKKRIVIKLSGSIFDPERPALIEKFAVFLVKISKVCQPIVIAGGGKIARHYIEHARNSGADESTLDELGIEISRLNAKLLVCALGKKAYVHPPTTDCSSSLNVVTAADSGSLREYLQTLDPHPRQLFLQYWI